MDKISKLRAFLSNIFFPKHTGCIFCDNDCDIVSDYDICSNCLNELPVNYENICKKCGKPLKEESSCKLCKHTKHYFKLARAPFKYEGKIKEALLSLKFNNGRYVASSLAYFLFLEYSNLEIEADLVIPLPISEQRMKERGYNQSTLLAQSFCKLTNLPLIDNCLVRVKNTEKQSNLPLEKRKDNVKNAFKVSSRKSVKDKIIVLIDDIFTTGATVNSACKTLLQAGAKQVYILVVAHSNN